MSGTAGIPATWAPPTIPARLVELGAGMPGVHLARVGGDTCLARVELAAPTTASVGPIPEPLVLCCKPLPCSDHPDGAPCR